MVGYEIGCDTVYGIKRSESRTPLKNKIAVSKHWKKPNKRWRSFIRLGIKRGQAYSWSRSRLGGWRIAQSPMMGTTVTVKRLQQRGYLSFWVQYGRAIKTLPQGIQLKFAYVY